MGIKFTAMGLGGCYLIDPERFADERGFLARGYSEGEFAALGIHRPLVEAIISFNLKRHTVRGMHYQREPRAQAKLVRCTAGAIYDVVIDLRRGSETFGRWDAAELSAENRRMIYVPEGFAHGYQTLADGTEVFYLASDLYAPEYADGLRWDDPAFRIEWPATDGVIVNERDRTYPDFEPRRLSGGAPEGSV